MRLAAARGLQRYDMCGPGRFKKKFGGTLRPLARWHKSHWRSARWARYTYAMYFEKQIMLRGWWQRVSHQPRGRRQDQDA